MRTTSAIPTRPENVFTGGDHNYAQAGLETVDSYVTYLDNLTMTTGALRRYSVSAITVMDDACRAQHASMRLRPSWARATWTWSINRRRTRQRLRRKLCHCFAGYSAAHYGVEHAILLERETGGVFHPGECERPCGAQGPGQRLVVQRRRQFILFHGTAVPASGASVLVQFRS